MELDNKPNGKNPDHFSLANESLRLSAQASLLRVRALMNSGDVSANYNAQADRLDAERTALLAKMPTDIAYHS